MPTGDPPMCCCPQQGLSYACPVHCTTTYTTTAATAGYSNWSTGWLMNERGISDADIERIAKRVAELLKDD